MDVLLQELIELIEGQEFPHKDEFLDAVKSGQCAIHGGTKTGGGAPVPGSQLLGIYRRRREHLSKIQSAHAQALALDVAWFCRQLELSLPDRLVIWTVDIGHPYQLDFFIDEETKAVFGCMKTVSQLDVTPDEWERLWSEN
jgi:hypothetical protein